MSLDPKVFMKSFSPKMLAKATQAFDRATTVVVGACWGAAVLMMAFAVYTMFLSISAKHASEAALVAEPSLPKVIQKTIDTRTTQVMIERMQHRYPDITFSLQNNQGMTITAIDGGKFRQWLMALSYVDTISPEYHWKIQQFCVGKCRGAELMRAVLVGEKISFEAPKKP